MSTLIVKEYTRTRRASEIYGGRGWQGREEEGAWKQVADLTARDFGHGEGKGTYIGVQSLVWHNLKG
jgi:hypothetical protein